MYTLRNKYDIPFINSMITARQLNNELQAKHEKELMDKARNKK